MMLCTAYVGLIFNRYTVDYGVMPDYVIHGSVSNKDGRMMTNVMIQAMNSDHRVFHYNNDEMLGTVWTNDDGKFVISFNKKDFDADFFENNPDLYLIIRNQQGQIIKTTDIRKGVKPDDVNNLNFDIRLDSANDEPISPISSNDPYSNGNDLIMASFGSLRESIDIRPDDYLRVSQQLIKSLDAWELYTRESMWKTIGYDGPQVPKYPWKQKDVPPYKKLWTT